MVPSKRDPLSRRRIEKGCATRRPGLLYDISSTFAELGLNIDVGLIDTEGGTATDVFYVTRQGAKLPPDRQLELQQGLLRRL